MIAGNPEPMIYQMIQGFFSPGGQFFNSFFRIHYFDLHHPPHHIYNLGEVILFTGMAGVRNDVFCGTGQLCPDTPPEQVRFGQGAEYDVPKISEQK